MRAVGISALVVNGSSVAVRDDARPTAERWLHGWRPSARIAQLIERRLEVAPADPMPGDQVVRRAPWVEACRAVHRSTHSERNTLRLETHTPDAVRADDTKLASCFVGDR